jgi:hypothetical protein
MRHIFAVVILLCVTGIGKSQAVSPDEAMQKLQDKQAARLAERKKPVTITQGELDDLKAELASLRLQVAQLKNAATLTATKVEPVKTLAVGETKEQVMDYVKRHPQQCEIVSDRISTPHTLSVTTVHEAKGTADIQRSGTNSVNPNAKSNVLANQNENTDATEKLKENEKIISENENTEIIELQMNARVLVKVGEHTEQSALSGATTIDDMASRWLPSETVHIEIVEGKVTVVDRSPSNR